MNQAHDLYPVGCVATKEQVADTTEKFKKLLDSADTKGDGIVTRKELLSWRTAKYNSKIAEDPKYYHIASMLERKEADLDEQDVNDDGKVSGDEANPLHGEPVTRRK